MVIDKFLKDYKCEIQTGPDGKPKEVYVYTGPLFSLSETMEEHKRNVILLTALSIVGVILFVLGLYFDSAPAHKWYAVIPYALNFLTYVFFVSSVVAYIPIRESYNRRQKSAACERFLPIGIVGGLLFILSLVGTIVSFTKSEKLVTADFIFLAGTVGQILVSVILVILGQKILRKVKKIELSSKN